MTQTDLVRELNKLPLVEQLTVVERVLHTILAAAKTGEKSRLDPETSERARQLRLAAQTLLRDYQSGGDLTVFSALDSEEFRASG